MEPAPNGDDGNRSPGSSGSRKRSHSEVSSNGSSSTSSSEDEETKSGSPGRSLGGPGPRGRQNKDTRAHKYKRARHLTLQTSIFFRSLSYYDDPIDKPWRYMYLYEVLVNCRRSISTLDWKFIFTSGNEVLDSNIFNKWKGPNADEIAAGIDLTNKVSMVTGANSGIGYEISKCLHSRQSEVLMVCRNLYSAQRAANSMRVDDTDCLLNTFECDLTSLRSVKKCADKIVLTKKKIDIVILNAGVFGIPWTLTEDGLETTFQVNFLSQYYLLTLLDPLLAPQARVVFVTSESHRNMKWDEEQRLQPTLEMISLPKCEYTAIKAYNRSKTCSLLAMHYLGYKWLYSGKSVFCAHPGTFVKTGLIRNGYQYELLYTFMKPFAKTLSQAAATPLYCAISPEMEGLSGLYLKNCKPIRESEIGQDLQLAFRMKELVHGVLAERDADFGVQTARIAAPVQQHSPTAQTQQLNTCST